MRCEGYSYTNNQNILMESWWWTSFIQKTQTDFPSDAVYRWDPCRYQAMSNNKVITSWLPKYKLLSW